MKNFYLFLFLYLIPLFSFEARALPKNVIIIHHANKIPGEIHLDVAGYERAAALPYYFSKNPLYNNPPITFIFAAGLSSLTPQRKA